MKVLHVSPSFFPATRWGGPIFSTKAICDWVASQDGVNLRVLTTDAAGPNLRDQLTDKDKSLATALRYDITYCSRRWGHSGSIALLGILPKAVQWADVVHLTGTYSFPTLPTLFFARLLRTPVVFSPRGAIQATAEWKDSPRKAAKRAFEKILHAISAHHNVIHVTAPSEAAATAYRMPKLSIEMIPNSVVVPEAYQSKDRTWRPNGITRLVFLSRVHEKKGIPELLDAMVRLPDNFVLAIYGTGDLQYEQSLQNIIVKKGLVDRVTLMGHVDGAAKAEAFRQADLFVLPSHSENFGIAIAEALAHGVPVITTDNTPWYELDNRGCGTCIALESDNLLSAIQTVARQDLPSMGQAGLAWMKEDFSPDAVHSRMMDLYERIRAQ